MSGSSISNPSFDPSNAGTLPGIINQAISNAMKNLDVMLPVTIIAYDRDNNIASVQHTIQMVLTDGTLIKRESLASVPVLAIGGGGFLLNFPQQAGNKGWIKASDRDISLYLQSGGVVGPNTARVHSFSDGLFIPDFGAGYTINGEDATNAVLQTTDGTTRIALWADRVKITTSTCNIVIGPDKITLTSGDRVEIEAPRFDVNSATINFASAPHVGPIPP